MRVRYTPEAFAEREAIFDYLDERNPQAAREVLGLIKRRIAELGEGGDSAYDSARVAPSHDRLGGDL